MRKVKTTEKATLTVPVHGGAASNDTMVRVDVFLVPGDGYYWVPVYTADTLKPELPNRAVVQGKPYSEWKEMREEDFIFSLYPNDLVYVEHKSGLKFTLQNADSTLEKTRTQTSAFCIFCGRKHFYSFYHHPHARQCLWHPKPWRQNTENFPQIPGRCSGQRLPRSQGNAAEIPLIHQKRRRLCPTDA